MKLNLEYTGTSLKCLIAHNQLLDSFDTDRGKCDGIETILDIVYSNSKYSTLLTHKYETSRFSEYIC